MLLASTSFFTAILVFCVYKNLQLKKPLPLYRKALIGFFALFFISTLLFNTGSSTENPFSYNDKLSKEMLTVPTRLLDPNKWMDLYEESEAFPCDRMFFFFNDYSDRFSYSSVSWADMPYDYTSTKNNIQIIDNINRHSPKKKPLIIDDKVLKKDKSQFQLKQSKQELKLTRPFYSLNFIVSGSFSPVDPQITSHKNLKSLNHGEARIYKIPYSSKETMSEISMTKLLSIIDPLSQFNRGEFHSDLNRLIEENKEKRKQQSEVIPFSSILLLKGKQFWLILFCILPFVLLGKRFLGLGVMLSAIILMLQSYTSDHLQYKKISKAYSHLQENTLEENIGDEEFRRSWKSSSRTYCINQLRLSQKSQFHQKALREHFHQVFPNVQDEKIKEEILLNHNFLYSTKNTKAKDTDSYRYIGEKFTAKTFYDKNKPISLFTFKDDFEIRIRKNGSSRNYGYFLMQYWSKLLEKSYQHNPQQTNYLLDIRTSQLWPLTPNNDEITAEYLEQEYQKMNLQRHNKPETFFMDFNK